MGGQDLGLGILISLRDAFSQNAHNVEQSMQSLDAQVAQSTANINRSMGMITSGSVMMGAGAALAAIPALLTASTVQSQEALAGLASMGVKDLAAVSNAATAFSNEWAGNTKAQIIEGCYEIKGALANLSDEAVGEFAKNVALTATATKSSFAEMSEAFTSGYGTFKQLLTPDMGDMEWARMFSGGLSEVVAAYKTNGQQMAMAMSNMGMQASSLGIPLQEQLALLGQLQTTMKGEVAGTVFKAMMQNMAKAGGELNLSFMDSEGHLKSLVEIADLLRGKFPDLQSAAAQMELQKAFGSDEAMKGVLAMVGGFDAFKSGVNGIGDAMERGTALTEQMAQAMTGDIGSDMKLIAQSAQNLSETLGEVMIPVMQPLLESVHTVIVGMQQWAQAHPAISRAILGLVLSLGGALFVVGAFVAAIGAVGLMSAYAAPGLAALQAVMAGTWPFILSTLGPVLPILAGVVVGVFLLKRAWETNFGGIRDTAMTVYNGIRLAVSGIQELVTSLRDGTGQMSAETARGLENLGLMDFVVTVFMVYYRVREFLLGIWETFSTVFAQVQAIIEPPIRALIQAFGYLFTSVFSIFGAFRVAGQEASGTISPFRAVGVAIGTVLGVAVKLASYLIAGLSYALTGVVYAVGGVTKAVTWVADKLGTLWGTISTGVTGALTTARAEFDRWAATIQTVSTILLTIFAPALVRSAVVGVQALATHVPHMLGYMRSLGRASLTLAEEFLDNVKRMATAAWGRVTSGISSVASSVRAGVTAAYAYARAGWAMVAAGVRTAATWVATRAVMVGGTIATWASAAATWAVTAASTAAAAATWAFGAAVAFLTSPIGLIILAVMALVGVGVLLYRNWDTVSAWLSGCWDGIKAAAVSVFTGIVDFLRAWGPLILAVLAGPIGLAVYAVVKHWDTIRSSFSTILTGLTDLFPDALNAGAKLMQTIARGITSAVMAPWNALKAGLGKLKSLLPHSDAKEGPLSDLTGSGFSVLDTLARGMEQASDIPRQAFASAFDFAAQNMGALVPDLAMAIPSPSGRPGAPQATERRVRALAETRGVQATALPTGAAMANGSDPVVHQLLAQLITAVGALADRPVEATVVARLDGRQVAKSVFRQGETDQRRSYEE